MYHWQSFVTNQVGKPLSGVSVTVKLAGTGTLASLFSDDGVTSKGNPAATDSTGYYDFFVADGRYDITISGTGITTRILSAVDIFDIAGKVTGTDLTWKIGTALLGNVLGFSSATDASVAADAGISRTAAKTFAFGNGTAADSTGTVKAALFQATAPAGIGLQTLSGAAGSNTQISIGRTANEAELAIAGGAGQFFTNADLAAGDITIRVDASARKLYLGAGTGIAPLAVTNTGLLIYGATSGSTAIQAAAVASGTLTLPSATDTLIGRATADTITNKTVGTGGLAGLTVSKQIFTASGTFTVPAGVTSAKCTVVGAGAAGGGSTTGTAGGGGGGGGTAVKWLTGLTPGNTILVTVGTGGTGVSNATGNAGGNSSIASGTQTIGTVTGNGGGGGTSGGSGGGGGASSGGDLNSTGQDGNNGLNASFGGAGGCSTMGGSGRGATAFTGQAGYLYGGAGGGSQGATFAGGAGANGVVIIEWII